MFAINFNLIKACQFLCVPPGLKLKHSTCWLQCIYVFLRRNSDFCLIYN